MDTLWAPWRMEYILGDNKKEKPGCIFCNRLKRKKDREDLILVRSKNAMVIMNRFPYNNGHLMVMPNRHVGEPQKLNGREVAEIHRLLSLSLDAMNRELKPDGFNIGVNLGRVAGAGVPGHVHWHIVPRWNGDTNFMPVLAETKVMPEHLQTLYTRLLRAFLEENKK
jgi:ATP adenylyltransferase